MDTGATTAVTNLEFPPTGVSWSPDGKQIAFISFVKGQPVRVAALPSPPTGARWADPPRIVDRLVYRFNGPGYLREGYYHVFVVTAEGGTPRQITSGDFHHGTTTGQGGTTVWTPDGKYVLVAANRRDDWEFEPRDTEIYEVSVDDGKMRALTNRRGPDGSPSVSPDGSKIAYLGYDDRYQGYQLTRLYVMERDGGKPRLISGKLDRDVINPTWTPDGKAILFAYDDQGNTRLATLTLDGRVTQLAANLGGAASAYSGGVNFSLAANGAVAFTYTTPYVPADVAVLHLANPQPRALTAVNYDLLSQRSLGRVEQIWYESSKDKRKIHGWIIRPPDFDPAKKYPLILEIHGGPFANYGDRFDFEKQVWAGMGYVVLYVNPRGSTSYGEEFGNLIHHAYPGDDFFDLNSGVDAAVMTGYVDPERIFVGGGSGGGVLTAWMIGRSTRFRAAVAYYPVINWISWTLTSDIPIVGAKYWFPGNPWDHVEQYWKRSLLSVVKNVKTPTMIITGEEDWRTPMSESEQYYTALKLLKVDAVLVRVPGEPHGIRRRPSHWMTKILEIGAWYEKYRR
jgi:acylaminoacyl-peptidase